MKKFMFSLTTKEGIGNEKVEFQIDDYGKVSGYHFRPDYYGNWQWHKMERSFTNEEIAIAVDQLKAG